MKKLPLGAGWLIGVLIGIAIIVLCVFFIEDGFLTGIITGPPVALFIGLAIEGQYQKPLTAKQKKMRKWSVAIGVILLIIASVLGLILFFYEKSI